MPSTFDRAAVVARSELYQKVREYFQSQGVQEVEVPVLGRGGSLDPHISSLSVQDSNQLLYLQTSPEFFMKRLLCEGSGDIFTICKAFRGSEHGRLHNPEFSMLEWYRLGFSMDRMIDDVLGLLVALDIGVGDVADRQGGNAEIRQTCQRLSYAEIFSKATGMDPHQPDQPALERLVQELGMQAKLDLPEQLDFIVATVIEPALPEGLVIIEDFPVCQAELAKLSLGCDGSQVARRFELYLDGVELANGYEELVDGAEQRARFQLSARQRQAKGMPEIAQDQAFLSAVDQGMPECAGVALGLDRLLMKAIGQEGLSQGLSFSWDRL